MKTTNRLVVVETVYYAPSQGQTMAVDSGFSKWLESEETPYGPRNGIAEQEWQPFDSGWIKRASMVVISNVEGKHLQVVPSLEEKDTIESKVIEVGMIRGVLQLPLAFALIQPGQSMRFQPSDLKALLIRCTVGKARYSVTIFPS